MRGVRATLSALVWRCLLWAGCRSRPHRGVPIHIKGSDVGAGYRDKIENALELLHRASPVTVRMLARHLRGVYVSGLWEADAQFIVEARLCLLHERLFAPDRPIAEIALAMVHEGAHARFEARGVRYTEPFRLRIEQACLRREIAIARRLPGAKDQRRGRERALAALSAEHYTDQALRERRRLQLRTLLSRLRGAFGLRPSRR